MYSRFLFFHNFPFLKGFPISLRGLHLTSSKEFPDYSFVHFFLGKFFFGTSVYKLIFSLMFYVSLPI